MYHFRVTVTLTSDLVFRIIMSRAYLLYEVGISNLVCGCILGWRSVAYHNLVTVTLNLTSDLVFRNCCISPIFFEIGIPNLVCKCILGCLSVTNHFWVTVTLTSDLVFKNYCVQSISPILFDVGIPNLGWWFLLGWRSGAYHFESLWPWHWLLASILVFLCYITAIFPQMCLILDQFLWGHSSRVCDISCLNCEKIPFPPCECIILSFLFTPFCVFFVSKEWITTLI